MQNQAAMLQCPNESCKAANHESDKYCQQCGTFVLKRYLWAVGSGENYQKDQLVAERYLLKSSRIFLDTKPGLPPEIVPEIVSTIKPYLKLIPYRLQIPQVYGFLPGKYTNTNVLLLEAAAIYSEGGQTGQLLPMLSVAWHEATSFRQLNWLWQIAQLWQPLSSEGVVSSLLNPELLRVEGSLVRLLELQHDLAARPNLSQLGQVWLEWVATAKPSITKFMHQLCLAMIEGKITSADLLIAVLDRGISMLGRSHRQLTISTATDTGTSRQRNEDACYPPSGTFTTASEALAIVCDGIGGHEGGNVASQLAIETLQHQVKQLLDDTNLDAITLTSELERFVRVTNDQISQRNDREHRFGRQRMGTTLVMILGRVHEIYITHVGDSRAYWITRTGCHQITLDDDVASREVRLGYSLYRHALEQASSGSLVQALGMSPSASSLHPTVQRLLLDEDCLFLLCSDGLSDYDRVEEYWDSTILPVFDGDRNLDDAVARLIEVANTQNGHDNVTVALVLCEVQYTEPQSPLSATLVEDTLKLHRADHHPTISDATIPAVKPNYADNSVLAKTKLGQSQRHADFFVPVLSGLLLLGLSGGLLTYYLLPELNRTQQPPHNPPSPPTVLPPSITPITALPVGTLLQINRPIQLTQQNAIATPTSTSSPRLQSQRIQVPANSVLKVTEKKDDIEQGNLIRLKLLCALNRTINHQTAPSNVQIPPTPNPSPIKLGQEGWIDQASLQPNIHKTLGSSKSDSCPL